MPQTSASPARPPRDLRLDIVRGWMQVSIFVSHVAGTAFAWGIHAAWGLSDSSEQFVLLSGLTLGSVFALKAARGGFGAARADMARRTLRLYGTHLTVFFMFAALALWAEMRVSRLCTPCGRLPIIAAAPVVQAPIHLRRPHERLVDLHGR